MIPENVVLLCGTFFNITLLLSARGQRKLLYETKEYKKNGNLFTPHMLHILPHIKSQQQHRFTFIIIFWFYFGYNIFGFIFRNSCKRKIGLQYNENEFTWKIVFCCCLANVIAYSMLFGEKYCSCWLCVKIVWMKAVVF